MRLPSHHSLNTVSRNLFLITFRSALMNYIYNSASIFCNHSLILTFYYCDIILVPHCVDCVSTLQIYNIYTDLSIHCLYRPLYQNTQGKYGSYTVSCILRFLKCNRVKENVLEMVKRIVKKISYLPKIVLYDKQSFHRVGTFCHFLQPHQQLTKWACSIFRTSMAKSFYGCYREQ